MAMRRQRSRPRRDYSDRSVARVARRRRHGRPRQDSRDQLIVDLAAALAVIFDLGRQQARDLALALLEGTAMWSRRPGGLLTLSFRLPTATVKGRSDAIKRKRQPPRATVVAALIALLQHGHTFTG
jgi:hypothetical protein